VAGFDAGCDAGWRRSSETRTGIDQQRRCSGMRQIRGSVLAGAGLVGARGIWSRAHVSAFAERQCLDDVSSLFSRMRNGNDFMSGAGRCQWLRLPSDPDPSCLPGTCTSTCIHYALGACSTIVLVRKGRPSTSAPLKLRVRYRSVPRQAARGPSAPAQTLAETLPAGEDLLVFPDAGPCPCTAPAPGAGAPELRASSSASRFLCSPSGLCCGDRPNSAAPPLYFFLTSISPAREPLLPWHSGSSWDRASGRVSLDHLADDPSVRSLPSALCFVPSRPSTGETHLTNLGARPLTQLSISTPYNQCSS
jgi:hypothetical protein